MHAWVALSMVMVVAAGCARSGPQVLTITANQYDVAFDAAVAAARDEGLDTIFRDQRAGVIETQPRITASLLEPWRNDADSLRQAVENTLAFQRRRARFEFNEAGSPPPIAAANRVAGPDLIGADRPRPDLTETDSPLELRVVVFVQRQHQPGIRRDTWSLRNSTKSEIFNPENPDEPMPESYWTPVSRDPAFERRLLAAVRDRLVMAQDN